ncbi:hypothetical protein E0Z10_g10778 [Xylaria hypoxylon]|uniref:SRR1-like domain-containing protein n=1 Tax=Xylaria hypoxylon TaxID=37992 RepID=A0A4Z0YCW6_9PEZI|nr:hypothetical protein E0Z10_g10778 [Xylaria hypoxylon]
MDSYMGSSYTGSSAGSTAGSSKWSGTPSNYDCKPKTLSDYELKPSTFPNRKRKPTVPPPREEDPKSPREENPKSPREENPNKTKLRWSSAGRDLYDSGKLLWTKLLLKDFQDQIAANPKHFFYHHPDGNVIKEENPAFGEDLKEGLNRRTQVVFLGFRYLLYPVESDSRRFDFATFSTRRIDIRKPQYAHFQPKYQVLDLDRKFKEAEEHWAQCEARYLIENVLSKYELPPTINKVICFGLGNDITRDFETQSQHPAALTIREYLEEKLGNNIRLLAHDPEYTSDTVEVLKRHGFEVDMVGIQGFIDVDENSLVLSIKRCARVKQVLADIARPAVFITVPFHEQDLHWAEIDWIKLQSDPTGPGPLEDLGIVSRRRWDPDTPRTKAMFDEYYDAGPWTDGE